MEPGHYIFVRALTLGFLEFGGFLEVPYVRTTLNLFFALGRNSRCTPFLVRKPLVSFALSR